MASALDNLGQLLYEVVNDAINSQMEEVDIEGEVEKAIENEVDKLDFGDRVQEAVDDVDIEGLVERAVDNADINSQIEDAIDGIDIPKLVKESVDHLVIEEVVSTVMLRLLTSGELKRIVIQMLEREIGVNDFCLNNIDCRVHLILAQHLQQNHQPNWFQRLWKKIKFWG